MTPNEQRLDELLSLVGFSAQSGFYWRRFPQLRGLAVHNAIVLILQMLGADVAVRVA